MILSLELITAILDSIPEAVEVADQAGKIIYVNQAFQRITGVSAQDRVGQNIFMVSPDGALARALLSGKPVINHRVKVGGSDAEVISNAVPILINNQPSGAVVVFQHITGIIKLIEELRRTTSMVKDLADKFGQVTQSRYSFEQISGHSTMIKNCITTARQAALSNSTILLLGESGTGKELFAHAIHQASCRSGRPFITVNCAAIPEQLLESEFFGHVRGAFTGAVKDKIGKFELAHGGTLFLDEIGDMSPLLQAKLLRVLQEKEFQRVGSNQTRQVNVRVIAATNRNLKDLIAAGTFREDLYYRLNVVELILPPLRSRKEDLPVLVKHILAKLNNKLGKKVQDLVPEAERVLMSYHWPGNIRELENVLERVLVTNNITCISAKELNPYLRGAEPCEDFEIISLDQMEKKLIYKVLTVCGSSVQGKRQAAAMLNISLATLYNKIKKYHINI